MIVYSNRVTLPKINFGSVISNGRVSDNEYDCSSNRTDYSLYTIPVLQKTQEQEQW